MQKTVFVVGLEFDDAYDFLLSVEGSGRKVFATCSVPPDDPVGEITFVPWKKSSSISARTALLSVCNEAQQVDEVVFMFDAPRLAALLSEGGISDYIRASEEFLMGYVYMYKEVERLFKKNGRGRIVFGMRPGEIFDPAAKEPNFETALGAPMAMVPGAFRNLAQSLCTAFKDYENVSVVLVQDDGSTEAVFAAWLFSFLNEADASRLRGWICPGAKPKGLFSIFKR